MEISDIYVHDAQLHRVIEDIGADTVTMAVELPMYSEDTNRRIGPDKPGANPDSESRPLQISVEPQSIKSTMKYSARLRRLLPNRKQ
jgi:hypothetical protein